MAATGQERGEAAIMKECLKRGQEEGKFHGTSFVNLPV